MVYDGVEKEITIQGEYKLSATLTVPLGANEPLPAVVIVPGTGSADRDGNLKNFEMNLYKNLAKFITSLGFVTIRYDKRGIGKSEGNILTCGVNDLVDDVISNVKYVQQLANVDSERIILLGHSEGCILNTLAYHRHRVAGLILIAGAGAGLKSALIYQNELSFQEIQQMNGLKGKLLKLLIKEESIVKKQKKLFELVQSSTEDIIKIQF